MTKSKILTYWVLIAITFCSQLHANTQVDSLLNIIETSEIDSLKIQTHFQLYRALLYNDPDGAKKSIDDAFVLAKKINNKKAIILCNDKWGGIEMNNANYPKAIEYYKIADSLLQDFSWPREQAVIYGNLSGIYKDMSLYDEALDWNDKFMEIAKQIDNVTFLGFGKSVSGDIYFQKAQYNLAIKHHLEALSYFEIGGDSSRIADGYLKLGEVNLAAERYLVAKSNVQVAADLYKKLNDQFYYCEALKTLGSIAIQVKEYSLARGYYQTIDSISNFLDGPYFKALANKGFEEVSFGLKDYAAALEYNALATKSFLEINDNYYLAWQYIDEAKMLNKINNNQMALLANQKAEAICEEFDYKGAYEGVYENYYNIYKAQGKFKHALASHENVWAIIDSIRGVETKTQIEELQLIYNVEKKEQEIILIQRENDLLKTKSEVEVLKKQRLLWSFLGLIILSSIIILWQYQSYLKNKRIQIEKEKSQKVELEAQKKEKQQLERELTTQVLQLCRKNEVLSSVKNQVSDIIKSDKEILKTELKSIERNINFDLQNEETWSRFLATFSKVHPDFVSRLRTKADKITSSEQRVACLIKMNMSSKQMASILNISPEGIKKARYRLRKKLNLESSIDLVDFMAKA